MLHFAFIPCREELQSMAAHAYLVQSKVIQTTQIDLQQLDSKETSTR